MASGGKGAKDILRVSRNVRLYVHNIYIYNVYNKVVKSKPFHMPDIKRDVCLCLVMYTGS